MASNMFEGSKNELNPRPFKGVAELRTSGPSKNGLKPRPFKGVENYTI